jgi:flagellar motor protein MotB
MDSEGNIISVISRQALYRILDIDNATYSLWLKGYTNTDQIDKKEYASNVSLSTAMRLGNNAILQYLIENGEKYSTQKDIRLLETYGEIAPQRNDVTARIEAYSMGRTKKWSK